MKQLSLQKMPHGLLKIGIALRSAALIAAEPIDYLSRIINGEHKLPPLLLRRYAGPLDSFRHSGAEFTGYLKLMCHLLPNEQILDIGCGPGLMALELIDYLDKDGKYVGVDIHRDSILWCQKKISSNYQNFTFAHINVKNRAYNPNGKYAAEEFTFPFEKGAFDIILLKSVFTHMRPSEVDSYLKEIRRLLSNKGRCVATFFLLNQEQNKQQSNGLNKIDFNFGDDIWRYQYKTRPEVAVAYSEDYILRLLSQNGLRLVPGESIKYGTWSEKRWLIVSRHIVDR